MTLHKDQILHDTAERTGRATLHSRQSSMMENSNFEVLPYETDCLLICGSN